MQISDALRGPLRARGADQVRGGSFLVHGHEVHVHQVILVRQNYGVQFGYYCCCSCFERYVPTWW